MATAPACLSAGWLAAEPADGGAPAPSATQPTLSACVYGAVRFEGDLPRSWRAEAEPAVPLAPIASEAALNPAAMTPPRAVAVTAEGGVRDVVVLLESPEARARLAAAAPARVEIDQVGSVFIPHVTILPRGGTLAFKNSDGITHNVRVDEGGVTDRNYYLKGGEEVTTVFRRAGRARILCDLHAWMRAYLVIADTPYGAVCDAEGRFRIEGIPPGRYMLRLSHPRLSARDGPLEIEIGPGQTVELAPIMIRGGD